MQTALFGIILIVVALLFLFWVKMTTPNKSSSNSNKEGESAKNNKHESVTDTIPYLNVYKNGIIEVSEGRFSKSYKIPEVNFKTADGARQKSITEQYSQFLAKFDPSVTVEITLYNKTIDIEEFKKEVLIDMKADGLDEYREEYNQMLIDKMTGAKNNLITEKYMTITVEADDIFAANEKFSSDIDVTVADELGTLTKLSVQPMDIVERLNLMYSIYHPDEENPLYQTANINGEFVESFSLENCERQGITTKDVIAPASFEFKGYYFKVGEKYARSFYVQNWPTWVKGSMLTSFTNIPTNMLVSVHFHAQDTQESIKMVKRQNVNINANIVDRQKKAVRSGYSADLISPELMSAREEAQDLMDAITKDNSKLFTTTLVFTIFADDLDELKRFHNNLTSIATGNLMKVTPLSLQQENGLNASLPIGNNTVKVDRLMTTQSLGNIIPFYVQEVRDKNGMYYGQNAESHNMILMNRTDGILNPNSCILGMPGAGKSFAAKREMINVLLATGDDVYVIDPEREYKHIAEELGGAVVKIANGSTTYINPFDLNLKNVDDENGGSDPIKIKSDFIQTICEIMIGGKYGLAPIQQSLIDRSVRNIYDPYMLYLKKTGKDFDIEHAPTLKDFYEDLKLQTHPEALNIALSLERYVLGAYDIFAHPTNLEITNRFTVYDIKDIGGGLMELGLQVCLDNIWNKMITNHDKKKRTWVYIDEFYLMMQRETSASYIAQIWKRARKWDGLPCAITQNVEDMLKSEDARTIINNCAFVTLLGQTPINKQQLSNIYNLSAIEQKYISAAKPGMGLIYTDDSIIPMNDDFPKNTKLYKLMSTKPDERMY